MMVRDGSAATTTIRKPRRDPKRRYDLELSSPGAEIRVPALPRLQFGWRFLSGILVVGIFILLYTLWNSPEYRVDQAYVMGINRLTTQQINTVINVSGLPIFSVKPRSLEQDLRAAFPELSDVSVIAQFPAQVIVDVTERQPVISWEQDGETVWIDKEGVAFPPRGEGAIKVKVSASAELDRFPESGDASGRFLEQEHLDSILQMSEYTPKKTEILYDPQHGLGWVDPEGWRVFFGLRNDDIDLKLQSYQAIVAFLAEEDIRPGFISMEYLHAPYYRLDR